jgi:hypothetical protein
MSSRRKCEKRHIGFLTSIYRDGTSRTVCRFAPQILRQQLLHCVPRKTQKLGMCCGCCDALPGSELGQSRRSRDISEESGLPPAPDLSRRRSYPPLWAASGLMRCHKNVGVPPPPAREPGVGFPTSCQREVPNLPIIERQQGCHRRASPASSIRLLSVRARLAR